MSYLIYHSNLRRSFRVDDISIAIVPMVKTKTTLDFDGNNKWNRVCTEGMAQYSGIQY